MISTLKYILAYSLVSTLIFFNSLLDLNKDGADSKESTPIEYVISGKKTAKVLERKQINAYLLAVKYPKPPADANCPQWWKTAIDAGWPKDLLPQLDIIIYRESRCNKMSHNPTDPMGGSYGLAQINAYWCKTTQYNPGGWLQANKILKTCDDLFIPKVNLKAAKAIWDYAENKYGNGWGPWSTKRYLK